MNTHLLIVYWPSFLTFRGCPSQDDADGVQWPAGNTQFTDQWQISGTCKLLTDVICIIFAGHSEIIYGNKASYILNSDYQN